MFWIILILIIILFLCFLGFFQFKKIRLPNVYLVTGAVKTGKSFCSCWLAVYKYKLVHLKWWILKHILFFIPKFKNAEEPLLFSNIPLANVKYVKLTKEIIERKVRIPYKSVVFIDEASLLISQFDYKDEILNEKVQLFIKLFGHYSKGGYLIYNTQDLKDVHFGFKRCTSHMLYIHSKIKLPFITILKCRELISLNDDDVSTENNFNEDIERNMLKLIVWNKYYRYYDCYSFSALTDHLPIENNVIKKCNNRKFQLKRPNLKTKKIISFKKFKSFDNERSDE